MTNIYCESCKKWHKPGKHAEFTTSGKDNVDAVIGFMMRTFRLRS